MDVIVLLCVISAGLATGVLIAYATCVAMFGIFQMHARQVAGAKVNPAAASTVTTVTAIGG